MEGGKDSVKEKAKKRKTAVPKYAEILITA